MPINTPTGYLDITNATLRGSKIVTTGYVGIANANPTNHLSIGSNLHINDTHSNVLQISGNINAASVVLGGITIAPTFDLEVITNTGNTTPNTLEFNNAATAFVTTAGATIGGTLTANKLTGDGSGISAIQSSNVTDFASNVSRITALETDLGNNSTRITNLSSNLSDNSTRITNLSSNLSDNSSRITALESGDISISGDKTFTGDVIFESNVHMNGGNVFVANTINMTVSDPIIELGSNNSGTNDLGIIMTRPNNNSNVAVVFDESVDILRMGYTLNGASDSVIDLDSNALAVSVQGALSAASVSGDGSGLTDLNASNITTGALSTTSVTIDDYLIHDGDTDTKVGFPSADTFTVTTANSERLRVDSSGNVGVGTTSPGTAIEIYGEGKDFAFKYDTGLTRQSAANRDSYYSAKENSIKRVGDRNIFDGSSFTPDTTHEILFGFSDTYTQWQTNDEYYPSYNEMRFKLWTPTNSTTGSLNDIMTLRSDGNVGIGDSSPSYKLDVNGSVGVSGKQMYPMLRWEIDLTSQSTTNFYPIEFTHPFVTSLPDMHPIHFKVFGESLSGGDSYNENTLVGYAKGGGYTDHGPMYDVHIRRFTAGEHRFQGLYEGTTGAFGQIVIYMRGGYRYSAITDATSVVTHTSAYTVGSGASSATFAIKNSSGTDVSGTSAAIGQLVNLASNERQAERFTSGDLNVSDRLGVGTTSPSAKLHVVGTTQNQFGEIATFKNSANANRVSIVDEQTSPYIPPGIWGESGGGLALGTQFTGIKFFASENGGAKTERMFIKGNGNVGIGTSDPKSALHVTGAVDVNNQNTPGVEMGVHASYYAAIEMTSTTNQTGWIDFKTTSSNSDYVDRIRGGLGNLQFFTNSGGERMVIDSSGRVGIGTNSPNADCKLDVRGYALSDNPAFYAWDNVSSYTLSSSDDYTVHFDSTTYNIGSHYNTSTNRFTCPVAGTYIFAAVIAHDSAGGLNGSVYFSFYVNGANKRDICEGLGAHTAHFEQHGVYIVELAKNDYVDVRSRSNTAITFVNGHHGAYYRNCFQGALLG